MNPESRESSEEPYGDFIPYDPECSRVKEVQAHLGRAITADEARVHRALCEHCMMLAVLSSEIVPERYES